MAQRTGHLTRQMLQRDGGLQRSPRRLDGRKNCREHSVCTADRDDLRAAAGQFASVDRQAGRRLGLDENDWRAGLDECDGTVFEFAGRQRLNPAVGEFLQFQRAFVGVRHTGATRHVDPPWTIGQLGGESGGHRPGECLAGRHPVG